MVSLSSIHRGSLLSPHSAKVSSLFRMPQTNKSRSASASGSSTGPGRGEERGEEREEAEPELKVQVQEAGDGGGENTGDPEIIKSPSDPKQYR